ncbi:DUF362 domain-containing protein [Methanocalculus taiwanensis]|uniref:DUF362 domain-containing protein n=1 Tax=Methanocalculus taiwanensis TaxID=106207 RepID=A0ABD4TI79_9EURY|nr:DUF362 domain-containing protein [Methanocalculus taiwanensis]MCQ1537894.1 DUF362 domain-containing protein [Methanocalculus taiwanensis]
MVTIVSSATCHHYHEAEVDAAVLQAIDLLGGIGSFVSPGMTVLLKPNLLTGADPQKAVTTHPMVVASIARLLTASGCRVVIADSPGAGTRYTPSSLKKAYERSGYTPLAAIPGVHLNEDVSHTTIPSPEGRVVKRFLVISPAVAADVIISLSKPKTHLLTTYTGAVKNLFGVVPGHEKSAFHSRFPEAEGFSEMLLDLHGAIVPVLHLMDAVVGMEGNGPLSGTPVPVGLILASRNPHALDRVACRITGIPETLVPTLSVAEDRGLIEGEISIIGDDPAHLAIPPFRLPDTARSAGLMMKISRKVLARFQRGSRVLLPYPAVMASACIGCGACVRICPVHAASIREYRAVIDLSLCIRCYCCHESCEVAAIQLRQGSLSCIILGRRQ